MAFSPFYRKRNWGIKRLSNLSKLHSWIGPELGFKPRQPDSRLKFVFLTTMPYNKSLTLRTTKLEVMVLQTFLNFKIFKYRHLWILLSSIIPIIQGIIFKLGVVGCIQRVQYNQIDFGQHHMDLLGKQPNLHVLSYHLH